MFIVGISADHSNEVHPCVDFDISMWISSKSIQPKCRIGSTMWINLNTMEIVGSKMPANHIHTPSENTTDRHS